MDGQYLLLIVLSVLDVASFLTHLFGVYFLVKTFRRGTEGSQHLFITSLAVSEMFLSVFHLLKSWLPKVIQGKHNIFNNTFLSQPADSCF